MSQTKLGNPAVVGLGGFATTTLILQIHNLGYCGLAPVIVLGFFFGGLAQLIAGFQEQKTGNNLGYAAFVGYGAFWIALCSIFMMKHFGIYVASSVDVGWFLFGWTIFTFCLWLAAIRVNGALSWVFSTLLIGFILLTLGHLYKDIFNKIAYYELIICAITAYYTLVATLLNDISGKQILPIGKPFIR